MDRTIAVNGITLIELLIAAFLVGLVGLAVTSVDISARRFMFSAQQDTGVQNEAGQAVAHIVDNIKYGWDVEAGLDGNEMKLCARIDDDPVDGTGPFNADGSNESIDVIRYKYDSSLLLGDSGYQEILFRRDTSASDCDIGGPGWGGSGWETIAQNISNCVFDAPDTNGDTIPDRLSINITTQTTSLSGETKTTSLESDVTLRFTGYKI